VDVVEGAVLPDDHDQVLDRSGRLRGFRGFGRGPGRGRRSQGHGNQRNNRGGPPESVWSSKPMAHAVSSCVEAQSSSLSSSSTRCALVFCPVEGSRINVISRRLPKSNIRSSEPAIWSKE